MDAQNSKRVRINAVQDAKGYFKLDITAEVEIVEGDEYAVGMAASMLSDAISTARAELDAKGMKWLADPEVK